MTSNKKLTELNCNNQTLKHDTNLPLELKLRISIGSLLKMVGADTKK
jgi:hypothetical protein